MKILSYGRDCRVPISSFPIHTCWIQRHAIFLLHLVFCSRTQSHQVSLNDIFMRISTKHNLTTKGWIDKPSNSLVSWNVITSRGDSPSRLHGPLNSLCIGFINYVFAQFPSMQLSHWWVNFAKPSTMPVLVVFPYHHFP